MADGAICCLEETGRRARVAGRVTRVLYGTCYVFEILVRHPSGKSNRHVNIQVEQSGVDVNLGSH